MKYLLLVAAFLVVNLTTNAALGQTTAQPAEQSPSTSANTAQSITAAPSIKPLVISVTVNNLPTGESKNFRGDPRILQLIT